MKVIKYPTSYDAVVERPANDARSASREVRPILNAVRERGDEAVREFTLEFDAVNLDSVEVPASDLTQAAGELDDELVEAITVAHRNIRGFHEAQKTPAISVETTTGVQCRRCTVPIERVGLYVPGGTAPLFSTVLMLAVPAAIAGCSEIILCTPPSGDGSLHPAILYAAHTVGVSGVYRIGGAQAIAAMAYGTETVPAVDKIFGPGNRYVTAAKQLVSAEGVAIDLPAGPTEVAIIADDTANPDFLAADILSQAEHGSDSDVLLIVVVPPSESPSSSGASEADAFVDRVLTAIAAQVDELPRADIARQSLEHSRIAVVESEEEAVRLSDAYAPEHLIIQSRRPEWTAERIRHAGSVFIGPWTPESLGDYASGTNHTLPTGGAARAFSGVSLDSFVRTITYQSATPEGLASLGPHVARMARAELLEGHATAVDRRLSALGEIGAAARTGFVRRTTDETDILVHIDLDGSGRADCTTGLGFLDHMLDQIARHAGIDLSVRCDGDLEIDEHHSIEDTAIAIGTALRKAVGDKKGIERYGFTAPMDEALATVALDLSGRAWLEWDVEFKRERIGDVPTEMFRHFFHSLCGAAECTLHVSAGGDNEHHVIEAVFKGFARALGRATSVGSNPNRLPSTKGTL